MRGRKCSNCGKEINPWGAHATLVRKDEITKGGDIALIEDAFNDFVLCFECWEKLKKERKL